MKRVRHVSMVDRDVALTLRVTERPKKLKPLYHDVVSGAIKKNKNPEAAGCHLPNANHDEKAGDEDRPIVPKLMPSLKHIEDTALPPRGPSYGEM